MASLRNSAALALLAITVAAPAACAEDYIYNYGSRSDFVTLDTGSAPAANLAIQHPTPWPANVRNNRFKTPARQGMGALEKMYQRYDGSGEQAGPTTVINVGK